MSREEAREFLRQRVQANFPDTDPITEAWLIEEVMAREDAADVLLRRARFQVIQGGKGA